MNRTMKETNIPWIAQIPDDWQVRQVKQVFNICKEKANDKNPVVLSLARDSVKIRDISNNEGQLAESYENYNPVKIGDLLLNPMDLYSGANCNVSEVEGVISPAYSKLRAKMDLEPRFFDYYFKTQYWTMAMFAHGKGVSFDNRWTLNNDTLKGYYLPFPSKEEQIEIVKAIKDKEEKINALIANEEKQIEKLKAYKQALISEVVTKGLDPNVPMKDSGIEWIGEIPQNCDLMRLKFLVDIKTGNQDTQDADDNGIYPFYVRSPKIEKSNSYTYDGEAILMAGDGAGAGRIFHLVKGKYGVHQRVYILGNIKFIEPLILYNYLETMFPKIMEYGSAMTTVPSVRLPMLQNCYVVLDKNIFHQSALVNKLELIRDNMNSLIENKCNIIQKLIQYRQSMIYEYVTGKKEVND